MWKSATDLYWVTDIDEDSGWVTWFTIYGEQDF